MTQALAQYTAPLSVNEMMNIGELFAQSGLFADIRGAAQATTKIIAGQELGIPPFAAMNGFHIIKGKAAMGAKGYISGALRMTIDMMRDQWRRQVQQLKADIQNLAAKKKSEGSTTDYAEVLDKVDKIMGLA